jgi:formaldehyde-activating enzyme involved in methanogenesis
LTQLVGCVDVCVGTKRQPIPTNTSSNIIHTIQKYTKQQQQQLSIIVNVYQTTTKAIKCAIRNYRTTKKVQMLNIINETVANHQHYGSQTVACD